ncbi:MAG: hypothetical protein RRZ69_01750 [Clostridia bacterium]
MATVSFSEKVVITDKDKIAEFRSVIDSDQPKISIAKRPSCQKLTKEELQKWISK